MGELTGQSWDMEDERRQHPDSYPEVERAEEMQRVLSQLLPQLSDDHLGHWPTLTDFTGSQDQLAITGDWTRKIRQELPIEKQAGVFYNQAKLLDRVLERFLPYLTELECSAAADLAAYLKILSERPEAQDRFEWYAQTVRNWKPGKKPSPAERYETSQALWQQEKALVRTLLQKLFQKMYREPGQSYKDSMVFRSQLFPHRERPGTVPYDFDDERRWVGNVLNWAGKRPMSKQYTKDPEIIHPFEVGYLEKLSAYLGE